MAWKAGYYHMYLTGSKLAGCLQGCHLDTQILKNNTSGVRMGTTGLAYFTKLIDYFYFNVVFVTLHLGCYTLSQYVMLILIFRIIVVSLENYILLPKHFTIANFGHPFPETLTCNTHKCKKKYFRYNDLLWYLWDCPSLNL